MDAVSRTAGGLALVADLKRLQEDMRQRRQNLTLSKPYEPPKTVLDGLVPKRISGPISHKDREEMTAAQNLGLDLKAQRVALEEERARKQLERLKQLEAQVRAAVTRGDMGLAKRLASKARSLGAAIQTTVQNGAGNYTAASTDDVAHGIRRLKELGRVADKVISKIDSLVREHKPRIKDQGPDAADLHFARNGSGLALPLTSVTV